MQTCKTKSFINRNCFSASKTSRSSGNQSDKTALYSTMVCHCSIDYDDNITYCLHLPNHSRDVLYLREDLYSNTVTIMLFFSDIKQYIPVKLCKSAGSIHLFQIYGQLNSDQIILEKNCLWDMIRINWKEVLVTLNGTIIQMPKSVKGPLRDKYRLRTLMEKHSLLLHVMLRQGTPWYALDNIDFLLLLPLEESEI